MAGELLKNLTGIDIVHVPYKGSTGARTDILSGQIQMLFDSRADHGADDQGRAWCARSAPAARRARRSCRTCRPRGSRRARLSGNALGRLHGAGRHAAADRRQAQHARSPRSWQRPDIKEAWEKAGRDADRDDAAANSRPSWRPRSPNGRRSSRPTTFAPIN